MIFLPLAIYMLLSYIVAIVTSLSSFVTIYTGLLALKIKTGKKLFPSDLGDLFLFGIIASLPIPFIYHFLMSANSANNPFPYGAPLYANNIPNPIFIIIISITSIIGIIVGHIVPRFKQIRNLIFASCIIFLIYVVTGIAVSLFAPKLFFFFTHKNEITSEKVITNIKKTKPKMQKVIINGEAIKPEWQKSYEKIGKIVKQINSTEPTDLEKHFSSGVDMATLFHQYLPEFQRDIKFKRMLYNPDTSTRYMFFAKGELGKRAFIAIDTDYKASDVRTPEDIFRVYLDVQSTYNHPTKKTYQTITYGYDLNQPKFNRNK